MISHLYQQVNDSAPGARPTPALVMPQPRKRNKPSLGGILSQIGPPPAAMIGEFAVGSLT